tara:strand:+ start:78 stop:224 length:147 start_codon:yes stop_codon:yes gene_type:complete
MPVKTKEKPKVKKAVSDKALMEKTICNLTDIVSELKRDVSKIKVRLGI